MISHFQWAHLFTEYLYEQLGLVNLTEEQQQLAEYIIGNIDDDGYLAARFNVD